LKFLVLHKDQKLLKYFEIYNRSAFYLYKHRVKIQVFSIVILKVMTKKQNDFVKKPIAVYFTLFSKFCFLDLTTF